MFQTRTTRVNGIVSYLQYIIKFDSYNSLFEATVHKVHANKSTHNDLTDQITAQC